jgi:ATP-dependent Clp protease ATP-binding subunit ClpB
MSEDSSVKPVSLLNFDDKMIKMLTAAKRLQTEKKDSLITVDHLLEVLFSHSDIRSVLEKNGLTLKMLTSALETARNGDDKEIKSDSLSFEHLPKYGQNFTELAEQGNEELRHTIQILCRRTKNNPVLIGPPGVGKTAVIEGLAQRIIKQDVPKSLLQCQIWSLNMASLVAGACHQGQFEKRVEDVVEEVKKSKGRVLLFIDEAHMILGAGGSGSMNAANMLKPALARGELRCICSTTLDEFSKYFEKDSAFERRFQKVMVKEPSISETISILRGLKSRYETHHGVRILDAALVMAVQQSARYISGRFLPDKAIDLMDEACANCRVELDSRPEAIDKLERQELQLSIEETSLTSEKDLTSLSQLKLVKEKLEKIREQLGPLRLQHETEKNRVDVLTMMKRKLLELGQKLEEAERAKNLSKASELKYIIIPQLEGEIKIKEGSAPLQPPNSPPGKSTSSLSPTSSKSSSTGVKGGSVSSTRPPSDLVTPEKISQIVSRWTEIPVNKLTLSDRQRLLDLAGQLRKTVVGQDAALNTISDSIIRSRTGLGAENRPTGSFLFLGSSGTGKTQTAKTLAKELFDSEKKMIRIDMSEYGEKHSTSRLIGAPPGYIGYDDPGQLTEAVKNNPYSVILFDEVEKAHPDVLTILLQVLDDGRLTNGKGKTIDFSNTIIILTSNLGSEFLLSPTSPTVDKKDEKDTKVQKQFVMTAVKKHFRPEFLNRLDDIVIFNPLSETNLVCIVESLVKEISSRFASQSIVLEITKRACLHVLKESYEPQYGARAPKRYLEKNVITKLSRALLSENLPILKDEKEEKDEGEELKKKKIIIDYDEFKNELTFIQ